MVVRVKERESIRKRRRQRVCLSVHLKKRNCKSDKRNLIFFVYNFIYNLFTILFIISLKKQVFVLKESFINVCKNII